MLTRGVQRIPLPPRFLTRPPSKTFRRMSLGADSAQPPAKMQKVEDTLRVKKISEHAVLPVRGSDGAAGYDLAAAYDGGTCTR